MSEETFEELDDLISKSGLKLNFIVDEMNISRQRLYEIRMKPTSKTLADINALTKGLEVIGEVREVTVYALDDKKVIKVLKPYDIHGIQNTGERLKSMQGAPFIPKLYEYNDLYYIQQRIKGVTLEESLIAKKAFNKERFNENIPLFIEYCNKADWIPSDWLYKNIMFDDNADIWIVDLGRGFTKARITQARYELKALEAKRKSSDEIDESVMELKEQLERIHLKYTSEEIERLTKVHRKSLELANKVIKPIFNIGLLANGLTPYEIKQITKHDFFDTKLNLEEIGRYIERNYRIIV